MNRLRSLPPMALVVLLAGCLNPATTLAPAIPAASATGPAGPSPTPTRAPTPTPVLSADGSFLERVPGTIRLMTYNVNWDSIFPAADPLNHEFRSYDRVETFRRILGAVSPDVVCLQEINARRSAGDLAGFFERTLAAPDGRSWQVIHVGDDVIAARFGLLEDGYELQTGSVLQSLNQAAGLVDLPDEAFGRTDLYLICSHFRSGGSQDDILTRTRQADAIMAQVRDFETAGGHLDLRPGTPFVILGDFNAYQTDPALHVETLREGDIVDQGRYGPDFRPDWDGTGLTDAMPTHNGQGAYRYTWRNDAEPFDPGALDRIFFPDSVLRLRNAFVLNTTLLTDDALRSHGLLRGDVLLVPGTGTYDHLPLVADFEIVQPGP